MFKDKPYGFVEIIATALGEMEITVFDGKHVRCRSDHAGSQTPLKVNGVPIDATVGFRLQDDGSWGEEINDAYFKRADEYRHTKAVSWSAKEKIRQVARLCLANNITTVVMKSGELNAAKRDMSDAARILEEAKEALENRQAEYDEQVERVKTLEKGLIT